MTSKTGKRLTHYLNTYIMYWDRLRSIGSPIIKTPKPKVLIQNTGAQTRLVWMPFQHLLFSTHYTSSSKGHKTVQAIQGSRSLSPSAAFWPLLFNHQNKTPTHFLKDFKIFPDPT